MMGNMNWKFPVMVLLAGLSAMAMINHWSVIIVYVSAYFLGKLSENITLNNRVKAH